MEEELSGRMDAQDALNIPKAPIAAAVPAGGKKEKAHRIVRGGKIESVPAGQPIISARGLELKNLIGNPYSGIDLDVHQGEVVAIRGRNGSGKSALLLTLAGRMRFTKGSLDVLGYKLPLHINAVQRRTGMAHFDGLNDVDDSQRIDRLIAAEFDLYNRHPSKDEVIAYLDEWDLGDIARMRVADITEERLVMLYVALAWVGHPHIIVVDDIESQLTKTQSTQIMQKLIDLAHNRNVTVLVGVLERDLAAMADSALYMEKKGR